MMKRDMLESFVQERRIDAGSFRLFGSLFFTEKREDILLFIQYEKIDHTSENGDT
jgi:hypothetical protein